MSKELNEDTSFKVSVKTLIAIGLGLSTLIGMWFTLQADLSFKLLATRKEIQGFINEQIMSDF